MRKVILSMMISADGYIESRDPGYNWHNWDDEMASYMMKFFDTVDTFIYGRKAYEAMIAYWPKLNDDFANRMNQTKKMIFSRTLRNATWNSTVMSSSPEEVIPPLKMKEGKDMVIFAGASLAEVFTENNLIDEFRLIVNPIFLGGGKLLFKNLDQIRKLKLKETIAFHNGNIILLYEPRSLADA